MWLTINYFVKVFSPRLHAYINRSLGVKSRFVNKQQYLLEFLLSSRIQHGYSVLIRCFQSAFRKIDPASHDPHATNEASKHHIRSLDSEPKDLRSLFLSHLGSRAQTPAASLRPCSVELRSPPVLIHANLSPWYLQLFAFFSLVVHSSQKIYNSTAGTRRSGPSSSPPLGPTQHYDASYAIFCHSWFCPQSECLLWLFCTSLTSQGTTSGLPTYKIWSTAALLCVKSFRQHENNRKTLKSTSTKKKWCLFYS